MRTVRHEERPVPGWAEEPWPVFLHEANADGTPTVFFHGNPTSADDWLPFLERTGGAAPDLPGFGRSSKRGDGDFTLEGYGRFAGAVVDALGFDRVRLVVHDWGAAALQWAAAHPERVERLVVIDAVPLLPGYRWHRWGRIWRAKGLGEVAMGASTRAVMRRALPHGLADQVAPFFDQGTQRAVLRLYRSADPDRLAAAGAGLSALQGVPSLVAWGGRDPYIPAAFAGAYARVLGAGDPLILPEAGHWPWLDDPSLVDVVTRFLVDGVR